jgi:hypothetical protein
VFFWARLCYLKQSQKKQLRQRILDTVLPETVPAVDQDGEALYLPVSEEMRNLCRKLIKSRSSLAT